MAPSVAPRCRQTGCPQTCCPPAVPHHMLTSVCRLSHMFSFGPPTSMSSQIQPPSPSARAGWPSLGHHSLEATRVPVRPSWFRSPKAPQGLKAKPRLLRASRRRSPDSGPPLPPLSLPVQLSSPTLAPEHHGLPTCLRRGCSASADWPTLPGHAGSYSAPFLPSFLELGSPRPPLPY